MVQKISPHHHLEDGAQGNWGRSQAPRGLIFSCGPKVLLLCCLTISDDFHIETLHPSSRTFWASTQANRTAQVDRESWESTRAHINVHPIGISAVRSRSDRTPVYNRFTNLFAKRFAPSHGFFAPTLRRPCWPGRPACDSKRGVY